MRVLLAAIPFVFPVFVAAQDSVGSVKDAPERVTHEMKAKTETIARALEGLTPEGFTKKSLVERYTEANLYEKIDGRSELFQSYDVTGMTFVTFSKAGDPAKFIDVFLYDMTTPLGTFGVFSVEPVWQQGHRNRRRRPPHRGRFILPEGPILCDDPDIGSRRAGPESGDRLGRYTGESPQRQSVGAMGPRHAPGEESDRQYGPIPHGRCPGARLPDQRVHRPIPRRRGQVHRLRRACKSADNAAEVLAKFKAHLEEFGDMAEPAKIEGASVMFAEVGGGDFDGACQVGDVIAGVTAVKGRDAAVKAMTFLLKGLRIPK